MNDYLENRTNLCLVFALIESGLSPREIDLQFVGWLVRHAVPFVFVFTKTDKVSAVTAQTTGTGPYRKLTKPTPASECSRKPKTASRPQPPLVTSWLSD